MNTKFHRPIPLPLKSGALFFDNSGLESYMTCPRKNEYEHWRRRTLAEERDSTNFGSAIHLVLDYRYAKHGTDLSDPIDLALCETNQSRLLQKYFELHPCSEGDWRNLNWAMDVCKHYNERWTVEPFNLMERDGKPLVELPFAIVFLAYNPIAGTTRRIDSLAELLPGEIPIIYCGKIDLPTSWDDSIIITDHKTTSQLGDRFWDGYRMSPQQIGYCWAWFKCTGQMPMGFCVNAIRSKSMPDKPKGGIAAWWEENFLRSKEYIDETHFEEWEVNTQEIIDEILWHQRRGYFPQKKESCSGKYGKCQFYNVCYTPFDQREIILGGSKFMDYNWSPLEELKGMYETTE